MWSARFSRQVMVLMIFMFGMVLAAQEARCGEAPGRNPANVGSARVLVAYYSLTGNTEKLAQAVAQGARQASGVTVTLKRVDEVTQEDLQQADGIILGSATYYANIPGTMKAVIDTWSWKMKVDFTDKVGGAFATGGGQTGGKEHVVISLLLFMLSNRMVVAGPLYQDAEGEDVWGEPGSSAITGPLDPGIGSAELDAARRLGNRVATLAKKLRPAGAP
jgi:NAD(P)H dehydrogenase (quinone)